MQVIINNVKYCYKYKNIKIVTNIAGFKVFVEVNNVYKFKFVLYVVLFVDC